MRQRQDAGVEIYHDHRYLIDVSFVLNIKHNKVTSGSLWNICMLSQLLQTDYS